jgi:hypothetical protein
VRHDAVNAMLLNEFLKEHKAFLEEQRKMEKLETTVASLVVMVKDGFTIDVNTDGYTRTAAVLFEGLWR